MFQTELKHPNTLVICSIAFFIVNLSCSFSLLPTTVAAHFGKGNLPDRWVPKAQYLLSMGCIGIGMTIFIIALFYSLRLLPASMLNVKNQDIWQQPQNYKIACDFMFDYSKIFAIVSLIWITLVHWTIVFANKFVPAKLNMTLLTVVTILYLVSICFWVFGLIKYFDTTPKFASTSLRVSICSIKLLGNAFEPTIVI